MRLSAEERRRWTRYAGRDRVHPFREQSIEEIVRDQFGRLQVDSTVACGVYVVVDPDDDVLYVGKVSRATGTIADRFREHHAAQPDWDRVWIMPCTDGTDPTPIEDAMIKFFAPCDNIAGLSCR